MFGREPIDFNDKFDVKDFITRFFATLEHFGDYFITWIISFNTQLYFKINLQPRSHYILIWKKLVAVDILIMHLFIINVHCFLRTPLNIWDMHRRVSIFFVI